MAMHGAPEGCYILVLQIFSCRRIRFYVYRHEICPVKRSLFSEVSHLIKIILIVPVTNAILEKGFSTFEEG